MALIEPVIEALDARLSRAQRRRLAQALALAIGPEAVISLRDVAGASESETIE